MERGTGFEEEGRRAIDALMAERELRRASDFSTGPGYRAPAQRTIRRSYLYDAPAVSPRHIRRQTEIAMVAMLALAALLGGWGLVMLVHWLAAMLGSGLTPRLAPGTIGSVLMTLPMA